MPAASKRSRFDLTRRAPRVGYTLIELLIVILLMGIMAALLLPKFEPSTYEQLHGAAQILSADLAYARNLAVSHDSQYALTFNSSTNSYVLRHTGANNLLNVLPTTPYRHSSDGPDTQTTYLEDLPRIGAEVQIVGLRRGTNNLTTSGTVEFTSLGGLTSPQPITIWLACGQNTSRRYLPLTIAPVTGITAVGTFTGTAP